MYRWINRSISQSKNQSINQSINACSYLLGSHGRDDFFPNIRRIRWTLKAGVLENFEWGKNGVVLWHCCCVLIKIEVNRVHAPDSLPRTWFGPWHDRMPFRAGCGLKEYDAWKNAITCVVHGTQGSWAGKVCRAGHFSGRRLPLVCENNVTEPIGCRACKMRKEMWWNDPRTGSFCLACIDSLAREKSANKIFSHTKGKGRLKNDRPCKPSPAHDQVYPWYSSTCCRNGSERT